jgi:signal transduction histidine kinase
LIGAFMLITFLVVLVQDIPLGNYLVRVERDRFTTSLERDAFLLGGRSADALKAGGPFPSEVTADVRRYGQASGARVVVVDAAGTAVATSDDDQSATGTAYGSRPEIAAALTGQINAGERYSQSLGQELLYVSVPVLSGESISGAVRLSYPASVVSDKVDGQLRTIWSVAATTVLLAGILAFFMARAVTRRLQQLRTATEMLAAGNLDTRTEEVAGAPELRTLAAAFNRMADRMKHLLEQQRGFASDASHQLRTPLTGLRLRLENALDAIPTDPGAARTMVAASLEETYRLQRIIDGLLLLSRAEGQSLAPVRINLSDVVRTRKEQWDYLAEETGVRISLVAPPTAHILVLPGAAEQIVDNLIDNALAVAPAGSQLQLVVARGEQPGITELHVLDEGPGLSREDCQRAFNRFWRGMAGSEGTGLGLSVVRQLAQASGATAALAPRTLEPATGAAGLDACVKFRTSA